MLIGIDVGGTNLVAAKVNENGEILNKISIPVNRTASAEVLCATLIDLAQQVANGEEIEAVGIGFPGLVDNDSGTILQTPNMPFRNTPFRAIFQKNGMFPSI